MWINQIFSEKEARYARLEKAFGLPASQALFAGATPLRNGVRLVGAHDFSLRQNLAERPRIPACSLQAFASPPSSVASLPADGSHTRLRPSAALAGSASADRLQGMMPLPISPRDERPRKGIQEEAENVPGSGQKFPLESFKAFRLGGRPARILRRCKGFLGLPQTRMKQPSAPLKAGHF